MAALPRLLCASALALLLWAGLCSSVCVEVPSETEAVQGTDMKLLCISCMKREEVTASTVVEWFYKPPEGGKDEPIYEHRKSIHEFPSRFSGRIQWNGSKDMQDVSITVLNVTLNDSGVYTCNITREFEFEIHRPLFQSSRKIHLTVVEEGDGSGFVSDKHGSGGKACPWFDGWRIFLGAGRLCVSGGRQDGHNWAQLGTACRGFQLLPWQCWDVTAMEPQPSLAAAPSLLEQRLLLHFDTTLLLLLLPFLVLLNLSGPLGVAEIMACCRAEGFCCSLQRGTGAFSPFSWPFPSLSPTNTSVF
uniref:Sodium channel regulatory subunit beta-3 n=2 Tax=Catharus TaxID=9184 RepID=A0A8C3Y7R2_CATUS